MISGSEHVGVRPALEVEIHLFLNMAASDRSRAQPCRLEGFSSASIMDNNIHEEPSSSCAKAHRRPVAVLPATVRLYGSPSSSSSSFTTSSSPLLLFLLLLLLIHVPRVHSLFTSSPSTNRTTSAGLYFSLSHIVCAEVANPQSNQPPCDPQSPLSTP